MSDRETQDVSYSQLKNWLKCPHYHKLISVTQELDYPENKYILAGRVAHDSLEFIMRGQVRDEEKVGKIFSEYKEQHQEDFEEPVEDEFLEGYRAPVQRARTCLEKNLKDPSIQDIELEINVNLDDLFDRFEGYHFTGKIDLIVKSKGDIWLIDWKTSKKGWGYWHKQDEKNYYQLALYRYFYHKKFDIPLENIHTAYIILNQQDEAVEFWELPDKKEDEYEEALRQLRNMIYSAYEKGYYPYRKTCKWCECEKEGYR